MVSESKGASSVGRDLPESSLVRDFGFKEADDVMWRYEVIQNFFIVWVYLGSAMKHILALQVFIFILYDFFSQQTWCVCQVWWVFGIL